MKVAKSSLLLVFVTMILVAGLAGCGKSSGTSDPAFELTGQNGKLTMTFDEVLVAEDMEEITLAQKASEDEEYGEAVVVAGVLTAGEETSTVVITVETVVKQNVAQTVYYEVSYDGDEAEWILELSAWTEAEKAGLAVKADISALGEITLDKKAEVEAAATAYEALTDEGKAVVDNKDVLEAAQDAIKELEDAAKAYEELRAEVEAAAEAYFELANGDLSTQALVDAAKAARAEISLAGLTAEDRETVEEGLADVDSLVEAAQADLDAAAYAELRAEVYAAIEVYVELADGDLSTQELIDAAKAAKAEISLAGINSEDLAEMSVAITAADELVEAAQDILDNSGQGDAELSVSGFEKLGYDSIFGQEYAVTFETLDSSIDTIQVVEGLNMKQDGIIVSEAVVVDGEASVRVFVTGDLDAIHFEAYAAGVKVGGALEIALKAIKTVEFEFLETAVVMGVTFNIYEVNYQVATTNAAYIEILQDGEQKGTVVLSGTAGVVETKLAEGVSGAVELQLFDIDGNQLGVATSEVPAV